MKQISKYFEGGKNEKLKTKRMDSRARNNHNIDHVLDPSMFNFTIPNFEDNISLLTFGF